MRISDWSSDVCSSDLRRWSKADPRLYRRAHRRRPHPPAARFPYAGRGPAGGETSAAGDRGRRAGRLCRGRHDRRLGARPILYQPARHRDVAALRARSEEHTSELQSLMRISYAVFCLKKKNHNQTKTNKKQCSYQKQINTNKNNRPIKKTIRTPYTEDTTKFITANIIQRKQCD